LLFAQGSTIVCLHHDTLAVERRFTKHKERVELVAVDNVSERGAGRLVFSYDSDETALVWDLFSGEEIARFSTFQKLKVAAWQKNGNVAFGNGEGKVILFEPSTTEHRSVRTIYDPITALAPAADCQTYAIG
jgi:WD40 repeat protein